MLRHKLLICEEETCRSEKVRSQQELQLWLASPDSGPVNILLLQAIWSSSTPHQFRVSVYSNSWQATIVFRAVRLNRFLAL